MENGVQKVSAIRGISLFMNFFQIILTYYMVKPAGRSIYMEHFRVDQLPYDWIASALLLGALMPLYGRFIDKHDRRNVVMISCEVFLPDILNICRALQNWNNGADSRRRFLYLCRYHECCSRRTVPEFGKQYLCNSNRQSAVWICR